MRYSFIALLLTSLLFGACKDDPKNDTGTLELRFLATYEDAPLVLGENLDFDGYQLNFLESDFFVSEIALIEGSTITEVKDVDFVDFTNTNFNIENAENGFTLSYSNVKVGSYDGIRFGLGLPPAENSTVPADYSSDHVMARSGYYWSPWNSYIFAKLAGKYEDSDGTFDNGFFFHTGTDDLFRTTEGDLSISISNEATTVVEISIDHKKFLEMQSGGYYDIQNNSANHDPTDPLPLQMFVNNYSKAISYK